ncbi:hypothetical protein BN903_54 [Halorubrum sp. AJ67]|nr:hypothetical protein BN903_54 [Halorubrum sp. AJ67]
MIFVDLRDSALFRRGVNRVLQSLFNERDRVESYSRSDSVHLTEQLTTAVGSV